MAQPVVQRIGAYTILRRLSTGGMAELFLANASNGKAMVVKRILADYNDSDDFITMFLNEAKLSVNLRHPNIVEIYDFGNSNGSYFLAMEYIFGKDVGSILKHASDKQLFIPIDVALLITRDVCLGLDHAHFKRDAFNKPLNIVHRDISPPNIMVGFDGRVKILDFGIAKATSATTSIHTRTGVLKGKFCYMSPEQAFGQELDRRTDIFSTAIVLYEMLTSRSLFYSSDDIEILERVRKAKVDPPSKLNPKVSSKLDQIIMKALQKNLKKRYQAAQEFADDLTAFLQAEYPNTTNRTVAAYLQSLFSQEFVSGMTSDERELGFVLPPTDAESGLFLDSPPTAATVARPSADLASHSPHSLRAWIGTALASIGILFVVGALASQWPRVARWLTSTPIMTSSSRAPLPSVPPEDLDMLEKKAKRLFEQQKFQDAIPPLTRLSSLNPTDLDVRARLGLSYIYVGSVLEACNLMEISLTDSVEPPGLYHLVQGLCFEHRRNRKAAVEAYRRYIKVEPKGAYRDQVEGLIRRLN